MKRTEKCFSVYFKCNSRGTACQFSHDPAAFGSNRDPKLPAVRFWVASHVFWLSYYSGMSIFQFLVSFLRQRSLACFFCNVLFWKFVSLCIAFGKDQIIIWFYPYQNIEKEIFWDLLRMLFQNVYTSVCILWLMILNVRRDLHEIQKVLFTDFTRLSGFWNAQRVPKQIWQGGYANGWTSIGAFDRGEASNQPVKD